MDEIAEPLPRVLVPIRLVSWHVKGPTRIFIIKTTTFFLSINVIAVLRD
jgi:hypothetical protein